jgi:hypothetical protein
MKPMISICSALLIFTLLITGCALLPQGQPVPTVDFALESTHAMETMSITLTLQALNQLLERPTSTTQPTAIPPTATTEPTATIEPPVIMEPEIVIVPEVISTETPIPTEVPLTPMLHVTESTNCRAGPSPMYGVEGYVTTDMVLPVRGINVGHSWWFVDNPTYPGYHCWVWKWTSVVEGDTSTIPVYFDPWTPTPGTANISTDITAWTGNQSGKCPIKVTFAGIIRSDQGGQYRYQWLRRNTVIDKGWVTIAADGSAVVSTTFKVYSTSIGTVQLQVIYPNRVYSSRQRYSVICGH